MAEGDGGEKTEAPTAKRRQEAIDRGDILQSRDLGAALVVLAGGAWLAIGGPMLLAALEEMLRGGLVFDARIVRGFDPLRALLDLAGSVAFPLVILFAMTLIAAVATPALVGSLGFRWTALEPKPDRLNPLTGLKRLFGPQGLIELAKSIAKVVLMGAVGAWLLYDQAENVTVLGRQDIRAALGGLGRTFVFAVLVMALALVLIAGIDVPAQFIQRANRLKMSKQEVRDEAKQTEGNPENKAAIRRRQVAVLQGSARKAVQEASVVLTNPTHFAVALRYKAGEDAAPVVVARGRDETADAIRAIAREAQVPMLSYPQLARAIYFTSRAGQLIREDLYMAVATVLAFVFNLDRALAEGRAQPEVAVPPEARFDENGKPAV